ncbi:MAG TPA: M81 family metallopeptidase, partial [Candidatus Cloacimonadota bacterium]|nr:M81 family metallopeptidase [Candidatus Cloacimonadota bacterium]
MNIAIGGFFHESNTFNPIITGKEDIVVFEKEEIFTNKSAFIMAKGIIDYFQERGEYSLYPLVFMKA